MKVLGLGVGIKAQVFGFGTWVCGLVLGFEIAMSVKVQESLSIKK